MDWAPAANNVLFYGPYARPYATLIPKDFHKKIWSEDNPDAYLPRPRGYVGLGSNRELTVPSDRYLQDISYCRLKNLTVSYDIPAVWTKKVGLQKVQVFFSGENLLTFTTLKGMFDPEAIFTKNDYTAEGGKNYPMNKVISFGLVVNL